MVVPEVFGAVFDEAVGEGFEVVVGGERAVSGGSGGRGRGRSGCGSECELGRAASLVG